MMNRQIRVKKLLVQYN